MLRRKLFLPIGAITSALISVVTPAVNASAVNLQDQPDSVAKSLLTQAEHKLHSVSSIQAGFEEIDTYPQPLRDTKQKGILLLQRPGNYKIVSGRFRRVNSQDAWAPSGNTDIYASDGKLYSHTCLHPHSSQFQQEKSTAALRLSALRVINPIAGFFENTPTYEMPSSPSRNTHVQTEVWEGKPYQVLQYTTLSALPERSTATTIYIGADSLIHRVIYKIGFGKQVSTKEWKLRNFQLNALIPKGRFANSPPKDAAPLNSSDYIPLLPVGSDAPDFALKTLDGKVVKLSDYRGKTVILDFWATWCWTCNHAFPYIEKIEKKYREQGVVVLAVAMWDSKAGYQIWQKKHNYPGITFVNDPSPAGEDIAARFYSVNSTSTVYVINRGGKIAKSVRGFRGTSPELENAVHAAVASRQASAQYQY
jgi:peroxiredoxin